MALRKPLVIINGQVQQIPSGDDLDASIASQASVTLTNSNAGSIVIGQAVYIDGNNSCDLAEADASATKNVIGLVLDTSIATSATGSVVTDGIIVASTGQWDVVTGDTGGLTAGAKYYLSPTTAGGLTDTAPTTIGQYVCPIGTAISTTEMQIDIEETVLL